MKSKWWFLLIAAVCAAAIEVKHLLDKEDNESDKADGTQGAASEE